EQLRWGATRAEGDSGSPWLTPGKLIAVEDHPHQIDGDYAVASVEHSGGTAGAYENRFTCVPALVPLRPDRPARRIQQTHETGVVVGPQGQEIHTDGQGRVRVQFHWDLDGKNDERSSCWLRVAQPWSGAGYGMQFIPRVGKEVTDRTHSRRAKLRGAP